MKFEINNEKFNLEVVDKLPKNSEICTSYNGSTRIMNIKISSSVKEDILEEFCKSIEDFYEGKISSQLFEKIKTVL